MDFSYERLGKVKVELTPEEVSQLERFGYCGAMVDLEGTATATHIRVDRTARKPRAWFDVDSTLNIEILGKEGQAQLPARIRGSDIIAPMDLPEHNRAQYYFGNLGFIVVKAADRDE